MFRTCMLIMDADVVRTLRVVDPELIKAEIAVKPLLNDEPLSHLGQLIRLRWKSNGDIDHRLVEAAFCQTAEAHTAACTKKLQQPRTARRRVALSDRNVN